jgi:hypothetical protein
MSICKTFRRTLGLALALGLLTDTAIAQSNAGNNQSNTGNTQNGSGSSRSDPGDPGPLPRPQPYFGTKTLFNRPVLYPDPNTPPPDPVRYWKNRIFSTGGYGGVIIIVNNAGAPCYAPWYYVSDYYYHPLPYYGMGGYQYGWNNQTYGFYVNRPNLNLGGSFGRNSGRAYNEAQIRRDPPRQREQERREESEKSRASGDAGNDYYLYRKPEAPSLLKSDPSLAQAVMDIETAFRTGNISLLERHIAPNDTLVLHQAGRTRRSLAAAAYLEMTKEALGIMKTARYTLNRAEPGSGGAALVYGTHVLRSEDGLEKTFNVGYALKKRGQTWVIAEVSAEPSR